MLATVPRVRIELTTPASSGLRSTTELPRQTDEHNLIIYELVGVLGFEPRTFPLLVGVVGVEPTISCSQSTRVRPLRYTPTKSGTRYTSACG